NVLTKFQRLVDPLVIGIFYGLFKSKKLPPIDRKEIKLETTYEFGVNVSSFISVFNHCLLSLWLKNNNLPNQDIDLVEYRKKLYIFIEKILDLEYFQNVIIPFYLQISDEKEGNRVSFLYRMWNSGNVSMESVTHT
ncbi:unnamed protein product, partial [marine sediment metagenome]